MAELVIDISSLGYYSIPTVTIFPILRLISRPMVLGAEKGALDAELATDICTESPLMRSYSKGPLN